MSLWVPALSISIIAAVMAIWLFRYGLKMKDRKESLQYLIWAVLFLGASFGTLEWALYLLGLSIWSFIVFPLYAYFAIWFGWIIWIFEKRGERKVWVILLIALAILSVIAINCVNCLAP
jgi:hypothetical protein